MSTGERIKALRLSKKLKQSELANKCGISRVAIGNYERGDRTPNVDILSKIAKALDVYIIDLLDFDECLSTMMALQRLLEKHGYCPNQYSENGLEKIEITKNDIVITVMPHEDFINMGCQLISSIENFEKLQLDNFLNFHNNHN